MASKIGLTNNQLKMIAMLAMLLDHIGMVLLPKVTILRIIGRVSFPIFAYMVGEGFAHTRNRGRYFLQMLGLAAVCQIGLYVATGSLLQCVVVSFTLAITVMFSIEFCKKRITLLSVAVLAITFAAVLFTVLILPELLPGTDFAVDYGLPGILIPIIACYAPKRVWKLVLTALCMVVRGLTYGGIQWFCLLSILLLVCYNGQRGSRKIKYLFYIFYPLHLVVIYGIGELLL